MVEWNEKYLVEVSKLFYEFYSIWQKKRIKQVVAYKEGTLTYVVGQYALYSLMQITSIAKNLFQWKYFIYKSQAWTPCK